MAKITAAPTFTNSHHLETPSNTMPCPSVPEVKALKPTSRNIMKALLIVRDTCLCLLDALRKMFLIVMHLQATWKNLFVTVSTLCARPSNKTKNSTSTTHLLASLALKASTRNRRYLEGHSGSWRTRRWSPSYRRWQPRKPQNLLPVPQVPPLQRLLRPGMKMYRCLDKSHKLYFTTWKCYSCLLCRVFLST